MTKNECKIEKRKYTQKPKTQISPKTRSQIISASMTQPDT